MKIERGCCENRKEMESYEKDKGNRNYYFFELFDLVKEWNHIIYDLFSYYLV